ncbi:hypothetical protein CPSG_09898 [Coccidioides posadasii str. Silveira]|uniref:Uncharacterized protein n=1 Tax=Coccidioides posadasii (strain RMSCC 757 / Silveira) TaxID=443226 RepID=E9DJ99_COCPS|nr:hypothetical protein CPSG_09898 [Coccidioides posadasii str. Silveira]
MDRPYASTGRTLAKVRPSSGSLVLVTKAKKGRYEIWNTPREGWSHGLAPTCAINCPVKRFLSLGRRERHPCSSAKVLQHGIYARRVDAGSRSLTTISIPMNGAGYLILRTGAMVEENRPDAFLPPCLWQPLWRHSYRSGFAIRTIREEDQSVSMAVTQSTSSSSVECVECRYPTSTRGSA